MNRARKERGTDQSPRDRRRKVWRILFLICGILGAMELLLAALVPAAAVLLGISAQWSASEASSIGIIGGADGPTAVFVATRTPVWQSYLLPAAMVIIGFLGYRRVKNGNIAEENPSVSERKD